MKPKFPPFDHQNPSAVMAQLKKMLPAEHFHAVEQVETVASNKVALVGGIVRDLFLGRENFDLDFVTFGFSHYLADELADHFRQQPEITEVKTLKHDAFGTARLDLIYQTGLALHIDLATARRESYARPGALPSVEINPPAPLEVDLKRRDFTTNAIALTPDGRIIDPFNGLEDLRDGFLRVLHPKSFEDDPTRVIRGMRYAARLGYTFEPDTQKLARHAIHKRTFFKLTPERRRNELIRILEEIAPERVFEFPLAREYDLIKQFHPLFVWNKRTVQAFQKIKEDYPQKTGFSLGTSELSPTYKLPAYLFALCREATPEQLETMARDLRFSDSLAKVPPQVARLQADVLPKLTEGLPNSQLYTLLHPYDKQALNIAALFAPDKAPILAYYANNIPPTAPRLGGDYLKELGLKPGKEFKVILEALRAALLDGKLETLEDEENFLKEKVKALLP